MFEIIVEKEGWNSWMERSSGNSGGVLGHKAVECMPCIMQGFIKKPQMLKRDLNLTVSSTLQDVYLNRVMTILMYVL